MTGRTSLVVAPKHAGRRLDQFLAAATELSRRAARRLIADGSVRRNGVEVHVQSRTVANGDIIEVRADAAEIGVAASARPPDVRVLHSDPWLFAVDKPAGTLTQPAERTRARDQALDHQVLLWLTEREGGRPFVRLVHRLDRHTSGVVLFARRPQALPMLRRAWDGGSVERRYLAVVEGTPHCDHFTLDRPIGRDRTHRWRFTCTDHGRAARTDVDVLARLEDGTALVRCSLVTGRTHQIRVHLADIGFPVVGDRLYGSLRADSAARPLLHALSLVLPHPDTGSMLTIDSPIPDDMRRLIPGDLVT